MNERIKTARKGVKGMTQQKLADALSLSRNYISLIESGKENPSKRTVSDMARILNVNETWLLTGEGEMHQPQTKQQELASMVAELGGLPEDSFKYKLIMSIADMTVEQMDMLQDIFNKISGK